MSLLKRALFLVLQISAVFLVGFVSWYCFTFILSNHPRRPASVPPQATLVFEGGVAFWERCWVDQAIQQNQCQIFNRKGVTLTEDVFLPYQGGGPVPESQLKIVSGGDWGVVKLQDGTILIPRTSYDVIRKRISGEVSTQN